MTATDGMVVNVRYVDISEMIITSGIFYRTATTVLPVENHILQTIIHGHMGNAPNVASKYKMT
ncbi:MAG: hypothetical protein HGA96_11120 [Desulfobulbaceae bacterium]|nr:hypothetical protein [Desulfobulbaceae bacterium]